MFVRDVNDNLNKETVMIITTIYLQNKRITIKSDSKSSFISAMIQIISVTHTIYYPSSFLP